MYQQGRFNLEDIGEIASILAKVDYDSNGQLYLKDGLLFANLQ